MPAKKPDPKTLARKKVDLILRDLRHYRNQLDYPNRDIRGTLDAATWKLNTWEKARDHLARGQRMMFDCSQFVGQVLIWAGFKDEWLFETYANGVPKIYTGTLLNHLRHYSDPWQAYIGACAVFGPGTGEHVSMVAERGTDPLVESHGRPGLDLWRLSQQASFHRKPITMLSIAELHA